MHIFNAYTLNRGKARKRGIYMLKSRMMQKTGLILLLLILAISMSACGGKKGDGKVTIGINQLVTHAALDAARDGFLDALKANGYVDGENLVVDLQNAQGSQDTALTISKKFVTDKKDMIFAIATPSAQASAQATKDNPNIPVLITAVTDPVDAGLVNSLESPGGNVTGTTDMNPVKEQLALVKQLTSGKRVGIIYNSGESNSEVQVVIAKAAAAELGLELVLSTISNSSEVKAAAENLAGKVDAFYIPTDNTVVSAIETVIDVAEAKKLPIVAGEGDSVQNGALITYGLDYYNLGYQTGEMAVKVLKEGKNPKDMPVESQKQPKLYINVSQAEKMGITIPQELLEKADEKY